MVAGRSAPAVDATGGSVGVGDVAGTPVLIGNPVPASGTRGRRGSEERPRWLSDRSEAWCRGIGPAWLGIVSEAQRGP